MSPCVNCLHHFSADQHLGSGLVMINAAAVQVVPGAECAQYELTAVLIHKGTSASHGHYGAHMLNPAR